MSNRIVNFSAGPGALPLDVLKSVQQNLIDYKGAGLSVMEMSHRSKEFTEIIEGAEASVRELYKLTDDYEVLFLQGGASLQFSMIPMNFIQKGKPVAVVNTGSWTKKAIAEFKKFGDVEIVASSEDEKFRLIPEFKSFKNGNNYSYTFITSNNTIAGTQWASFPTSDGAPLIADMSSDIFSRPIDASKFDLIFAGAQKNLGPSGVTLVILKKSLLETANEELATMLQYKIHAKNNSLYNTPPTFAIYVVNEVLNWIKKNGGLEGIKVLNEKKAALLYDAIDSSELFYCPVKRGSRSLMNVVFRVKGDNEELESRFIKEATQKGFSGLKGHRSVGGLRASIYNAQPYEGVESLTQFMNVFEKSVVVNA
ncbi:3-phosphoserine/phosphohydroxythreonine transaminase [bacterium]|jgi:phosphoserine aminotransferase|nr:3-phosphoserine/phosphohydroxythreonine transaminase [bacterium]